MTIPTHQLPLRVFVLSTQRTRTVLPILPPRTCLLQHKGTVFTPTNFPPPQQRDITAQKCVVRRQERLFAWIRALRSGPTHHLLLITVLPLQFGDTREELFPVSALWFRIFGAAPPEPFLHSEIWSRVFGAIAPPPIWPPRVMLNKVPKAPT